MYSCSAVRLHRKVMIDARARRKKSGEEKR